MLIFITLLLLIITTLLVIIFYYKKDSFLKKLKKESIILPILKDPRPEFNDDNDNLLNDIIESIEIEDWKATVEIDNGSYLTSTFLVNIINPAKTVEVSGRVYSFDGDSPPSVGLFTIKLFKSDGSRASLSYSRESLKNNKALPLLWKYIAIHTDELNRLKNVEYDDKKNKIMDELISLKRDRILKKIL